MADGQHISGTPGRPEAHSSAANTSSISRGMENGAQDGPNGCGRSAWRSLHATALLAQEATAHKSSIAAFSKLLQGAR